MGIDLVMSGPFFDEGTRTKAVDNFVSETQSDVAQETVNRIQNELGTVLKHPTGYYRSHIQTSNRQDRSIVTDGGVVYGPWLEGVSSRNNKSRFKGYYTFRRIAQRMRNEAGTIAERHADDLVRKLS